MEKIQENKIYKDLQVNGVTFKNVRVVITKHSWEFYDCDKFISDIPKDHINYVKTDF